MKIVGLFLFCSCFSVLEGYPCQFCNEALESPEELNQHTLDNHRAIFDSISPTKVICFIKICTQTSLSVCCVIVCVCLKLMAIFDLLGLFVSKATLLYKFTKWICCLVGEYWHHSWQSEFFFGTASSFLRTGKSWTCHLMPWSEKKIMSYIQAINLGR